MEHWIGVKEARPRTVNINMKHSAFLTAFYFAFITHSILVLFFGATGVRAFSELRSRGEELERNLTTLESSRRDLNRHFEALRSDPGSLVVEARSLWLFEEGDRVIRLNRGFVDTSFPDEGRVLLSGDIAGGNKIVFRVVALAVGAVVLLFSFVVRRGRGAR